MKHCWHRFLICNLNSVGFRAIWISQQKPNKYQSVRLNALSFHLGKVADTKINRPCWLVTTQCWEHGFVTTKYDWDDCWSIWQRFLKCVNHMTLQHSDTAALWHCDTLTLQHSDSTLTLRHSDTVTLWHCDTLTVLWRHDTVTLQYSDTATLWQYSDAVTLWHHDTLTLWDSDTMTLWQYTLIPWHSDTVIL